MTHYLSDIKPKSITYVENKHLC